MAIDQNRFLVSPKVAKRAVTPKLGGMMSQDLMLKICFGRSSAQALLAVQELQCMERSS